MEFKDYYTTLGVAKTATEKEIKQAFRKLARKLHPDVNPGDKTAEARFKEINEAYEVLGDATKRKKYDELGANWRMYEQAGAQGGHPFPARWHGLTRRLPHHDPGRDGGAVRRLEPLLRFLHHVLRRRAGGAVAARPPARAASASGSDRAATSSTRSSCRSKTPITARRSGWR